MTKVQTPAIDSSGAECSGAVPAITTTNINHNCLALDTRRQHTEGKLFYVFSGWLIVSEAASASLNIGSAALKHERGLLVDAFQELQEGKFAHG